MHDIRALRENPDPYIKGWDSRGLSGAALVAQITELDTKLRAAQTGPRAQGVACDRAGARPRNHYCGMGVQVAMPLNALSPLFAGHSCPRISPPGLACECTLT